MTRRYRAGAVAVAAVLLAAALAGCDRTCRPADPGPSVAPTTPAGVPTATTFPTAGGGNDG